MFTGSFAVNPATGGQIPVFVADYVLMGYGTGAIMAVPGQDERDWEFAERFGLPIVRTVRRRTVGPAGDTSAKGPQSTPPMTRSRSTGCPSPRRRQRSSPGSRSGASAIGR